MKIEPKILRNVCLTAHPKGCAAAVKQQTAWVQQRKSRLSAEIQQRLPKQVVIIGGSTGYGLAARINAAFLGGADTISVSFEREPTEKKTATPGWYNTKAFDAAAADAGLKAVSFNGDAFSHEMKQKVVDELKRQGRKADLVVYSLASPMRKDPDTGEIWRSVLKPIGAPYTAESLDMMSGKVETVTIQPAQQDEILPTVKVMGGEDWQLWMEALQQADVLADGVKTAAFSYIGPEVTYPIYREGTIGRAKEHLEASARTITEQLSSLNGTAFVSVNKALVTRASAVIPVVPLYISLLYRIMKQKGIHEGCTEQMFRLLTERLYTGNTIETDSTGRIRIDDLEMREDVQQEVISLWDQVNTGNAEELTDLAGYRREYLQLHGFMVDGVDYEADADPREI